MDLALANFHKYSLRKQQKEAVWELCCWVLLCTFFKIGISLWVIKIEMYISINTYSQLMLEWLTDNQTLLKYIERSDIGSIKTENHRKQTAYLVFFCRVIKNMKRSDNSTHVQTNP